MRFVAFLRAINVGGHTVTMDRLRELFRELDVDEVSTFIASGNVIFSTAGEPADLEQQIEAQLRTALGYEVVSFLRTDAEVAALADLDPFPGVASADGDTRYVGFLRAALPAAQRRQVEALSNERDIVTVAGRELHWLAHGGMRDATIDGKTLERAAGQPSTLRNVNTVRRLAKKFPPGSPGACHICSEKPSQR